MSNFDAPNITIIMKALKCKSSAYFAYSYSINILSKYSSLITHRPSMFKGRYIDYRSSMVDTSIYDLRRSTHRSSIYEGQHVHLCRSIRRSSKVDTSISEGRHIVTSIFEGRHIDLRRVTQRRKHHTYNS